MLRIINKGQGKLAYKTSASAGFDIPSNEEVTIQPGEFRVVKTGLFIDQELEHAAEAVVEALDDITEAELTDLGGSLFHFVPQLEIRPRSGLAAKHGVTVLNSPGTIDCDYPDEIGVILINHGKKPFEIKVGDRIAQGVVTNAFIAEGVELSDTVRAGGFGSTGVN